jgi:hypothetical protein
MGEPIKNVPFGIRTSFIPMLLVIIFGDWANKEDAASMQQKKLKKREIDCRRFIQNFLNLEEREG